MKRITLLVSLLVCSIGIAAPIISGGGGSSGGGSTNVGIAAGNGIIIGTNTPGRSYSIGVSLNLTKWSALNTNVLSFDGITGSGYDSNTNLVVTNIWGIVITNTPNGSQIRPGSLTALGGVYDGNGRIMGGGVSSGATLTNVSLVAGNSGITPQLLLSAGTNAIVSGLTGTNSVGNGVYIMTYNGIGMGDLGGNIYVYTGPAWSMFCDEDNGVFIFTNGLGVTMAAYLTPIWPAPNNIFIAGWGLVGNVVLTTNYATTGYSLSGIAATGTFTGSFTGSFGSGTQTASTTNSGILDSTHFERFQINQTLRRNALRVPNMGWFGGGLNVTYAQIVTIAQALNLQGWVALGYNTITMDAGWGTNDAAGLWWPKAAFAPNGITNLIQVLLTNGCYLGVHSYNSDPTYPPSLNSDNAYTNGFRMAQWGVTRMWMDGMAPSLYDAFTHFARGAQEGWLAAKSQLPPVETYIAIDPNTFLTNNWLADVVNEVYIGTDDTGGATFAKRRDTLMSMMTFPRVAGVGFLTTIGTINSDYNFGSSWYTTNAARADMGVSCLAPMNLGFATSAANPIGTILSADPGIVVYTNAAAILINQDPLMSPGQLLNSNVVYGTNFAMQKVICRQLANLDVAVGLWNLDTNHSSLFTLPLTNIPYLYASSVKATNVFDGTGAIVTGTLTSLVNTGGFNLFRLSR